jgi:protein-glutamine gamma-glutamyltransferase
MRFGLVHRVMTDALAALGVLAVVSTASLSAWTNLALLAGLALALAVPEAWQARPTLRHFATVAPLTLFIIQGARLLTGRPPLDVAVEFAALLQIVRLATRRGAAHDQQIIVLALLHFVAGTVLGGGLTYGLCFVGFLVVAPGALVLSHLRREVEGNYRQGARDRTGLPVDVPRILRSRRVVGRGFLAATCLLSVPILLFTTTLFVLFPRVGLSLLLLNHPRSGRMVGFSDTVDLGQVGVLRSDPAIALRFYDISDLPDPPPPRLTLRLRGTAFDQYDGRAWKRTETGRDPVLRAAEGQTDLQLALNADPFHDRRISFDLEPIDPPVVFLPPRASLLRVRLANQTLLGEPLTLLRGPEDELRYSGADTRGIRYDVFVKGDKDVYVEPLPTAIRARYLAVPNLPARIADLAHTWTDGFTTPEQKARALEDHLRRDFKYDLNSPSGGTPQPLDHFLFESKRGHCEFFSTAMAVMLRDIGIPSRNVTGFVGGTYNRFGHYYAVREGDAHSWVEAYLDDPVRPGWQTFDPTPPAGAQPLEQTTGFFVYVRDLVEALSQRWNRYVVGYDLRTQVRIFEEFNRRYEDLRRTTHTDKGFLGKVTRGPVLAGAILVFLFLVYLTWKRRRSLALAKAGEGPKPPIDPKLESAAALYQALESALAVHGISRPASLPPLRHAEDLRSRKHPMGDEVVALTTVYLETRFGGSPLTDGLKRDFERRVRDLRSARRTAPPPPA